MLETKRLILRPWEDSDAESLYEYASDPDVGPIAGWPVHQSAAESLQIIRTALNKPETYAVCLKTDVKAIGSIGLKMNGDTDLTERDDECELGYWIGKPFWGQGLIPEAAREMLRHAFEDLGMQKVWCGYYDGNIKSKRVQEKIGLRYQWTTEEVDVPLMHETRKGHVNAVTRRQWIEERIHRVEGNRKRYLSLLLLADEQESMIDRYLERGTMYILEDEGIAKAECVVTDEGCGIAEIKSLAVVPEVQGKGYGSSMIRFIAEKCRDRYETLQVGTGDSPATVPFYESCGFVRHHVEKDFFTDHYDHPIFEGGKQLKDMVYLRMQLEGTAQDRG